MPDWIRWMLVDSSGSMNPPDRPIATQFFSQSFSRRPAVKRSRRGSAIVGAVEPVEQPLERGLLVGMRAREDMAVADAVLQRNAPAPPALLGACSRIRRGSARPSRWAPRWRCRTAANAASCDRERPTCLPEQQRAEPAAIDEEVAFDPPAVFRVTTAVMMPLDRRPARRSDLALDARHPARFRMPRKNRA